VRNVLLIGGRGNIGAGLRTYLQRIDPAYRITSVDLPGSPDLAIETDAQRAFVDCDITEDPRRLSALLAGRDMVIYLARTDGLAEMNRMTDLVFEMVVEQQPVPLLIAASSVHACDGAYSMYDGIWSILAERRFDELKPMPERISSRIDACPTTDYGREKAHVEKWCGKLASAGHPAIAARWGGINAANEVNLSEKGYFAVWCHQEDAARFVQACYQTHMTGGLRSGGHYFVTSNNSHNIFDLELPRQEIGYEPQYDAEDYYRAQGSSDSPVR
jgi:hypothetical protein